METVQAGVGVERDGAVWIVRLHRPAVRNAVDGPAARALADAFRRFDADPAASVAVLTGGDAVFCAGADLKAIADGGERTNPLHDDLDADAPMGPTRLRLSKPVIAAVSGHAVAGGLELALWCDLRVVDGTAVFGVYCRRWGVPLIDGGTIRLSRLLGHSHALDLILTGRGVSGEEALRMGLANRLVEPGTARREAVRLATQIAAFPQRCLRADRLSSYRQWDLSLPDALRAETEGGMAVLDEAAAGAARFASGKGRHGAFE